MTVDWTILLTAISAIGAALAAGAATWQAFEIRKQVAEARDQGKEARTQFLQARYDEARPIIVVLWSRDIENGPGVQLNPDPGEYSLTIQNIGKGPAFHIRVILSDPEKVRVGTIGDADLPTIKLVQGSKKHWYHRETDFIPIGETAMGETGAMRMTGSAELSLKQAAGTFWRKEQIGSHSFYAPD